MYRNFYYDKVVIEINKKNNAKKAYIRHMANNEYYAMLFYCLNNQVKSFYAY